MFSPVNKKILVNLSSLLWFSSLWINTLVYPSEYQKKKKKREGKGRKNLPVLHSLGSPQWWHNYARPVKKALTAASSLLLQAACSQHEVHAVMLMLGQVQQMKLCRWCCPLTTFLTSFLKTSCPLLLSLFRCSHDAELVSVNVKSNL